MGKGTIFSTKSSCVILYTTPRRFKISFFTFQLPLTTKLFFLYTDECSKEHTLERHRLRLYLAQRFILLGCCSSHVFKTSDTYVRAKSSNERIAGCMHLCGRTCLPSSVAADKRRLFFASTQAFCPALLCLTWLLSIIHVAYLDPAQFCLRDPGHYNTILNSLEVSNPLLFPLLPE